MNHVELGKAGEVYVAQMLRSAGLRVRFDGPADLVVEGVPVEVKAAQLSRGKRYRGFQFCLHRDGKRGVQAPVVVLLCYWHDNRKPVAFVVPAERLRGRCKVLIPSAHPWLYCGGIVGLVRAVDSHRKLYRRLI